MCLIAFAIDAAPGCPLLVAANRDEYLVRPTAALQRWPAGDGRELVAGRDLREGGTWMGVTPTGRVAWLTNVRQPDEARAARSRGELVARWLTSDLDAAGFAEQLEPAAHGGFNLVLGELQRGRWHWLSNRDPAQPHAPQTPRLHFSALGAGVHTLSNASLNTPWPKAQRLADAVRRALGDADPVAAGLADALTDTRIAADHELPASGVPIDIERLLSSPFVRMPQRGYGTRASTVLRWSADGRLQMDEWTHSHHDTRPSLTTASHRREQLTVA